LPEPFTIERLVPMMDEAGKLVLAGGRKGRASGHVFRPRPRLKDSYRQVQFRPSMNIRHAKVHMSKSEAVICFSAPRRTGFASPDRRASRK
jgi:hypothetical protein